MGLGFKVINIWSIAQLKQINVTITFILSLSHYIRIHDVESDGWLHFFSSMHPPS